MTPAALAILAICHAHGTFVMDPNPAWTQYNWIEPTAGNAVRLAPQSAQLSTQPNISNGPSIFYQPSGHVEYPPGFERCVELVPKLEAQKVAEDKAAAEAAYRKQHAHEIALLEREIRRLADQTSPTNCMNRAGQAAHCGNSDGTP